MSRIGGPRKSPTGEARLPHRITLTPSAWAALETEASRRTAARRQAGNRSPVSVSDLVEDVGQQLRDTVVDILPT